MPDPTTNGNQPVTFRNRRSAYAALPEGRYKAFIDALMEGLSQADAYMRAYGAVKRNSARANASRLLARADVAAALEERRSQAARRAQVTADHVIQGLLRNALEAREAGQYAASNQAWITLGKHLGLFTERHLIVGALTVEQVDRVLHEYVIDGDSGGAD